MGVQIEPESVFRLNQNQCSDWAGICNQQFWTQKGSPVQSVCRQSLMFGDLPPNHSINTSFEAEFGLQIEEFIALALALVIHLQDGKEYIVKKDWLASLEKKFGHETLNSFFDAISTQIVGISESLKITIGDKRHVSEYHENTPLLKFPLVDLGSQLMSWYPTVVVKAVEYFIYDRLRSLNAQLFMRNFGSIFENYVERSIDYAGWSYFPEQQLMRLFPNRQCTDFLVIENGTKIFIEAKGMELPELAMTTSSDEILLNKVASSIIKAIKQANELSAAIGESEVLEEHKITNTSQPFLLVVTYKETYLGSCTKFYESIGKEKIDELQTNIPPDYRIPVENTFFLSADDLDLLCGLVASGQTNILQILERARSDDADAKTAKFMFRMHLSEWGKLKYPAYLHNETIKYFDLLTDAL